MTNQARRVQAEQALVVYLASKGQRYNPLTIQQDLVDLLSDLFHLLHHQGFNLTETLDQAEVNFQTEVDDHDY